MLSGAMAIVDEDRNLSDVREGKFVKRFPIFAELPTYFTPEERRDSEVMVL